MSFEQILKTEEGCEVQFRALEAVRRLLLLKVTETGKAGLNTPTPQATSYFTVLFILTT